MTTLASILQSMAQEPEGATFAERLPQAIDPGPNTQFQDRGTDLVLRQMLKQLPNLPSAAPEGVRPRANLDTFFFPGGGLTPQDLAKRQQLARELGVGL